MAVKTFKQHLLETRIKLRGFSADKAINTENFLTDYYKTTQPHPFNNKSRIVGNTMVELSTHPQGIHIHSIQTLEPRSGAGTEALKHLTSLADKHSININLNAATFGYDPRHIGSNEKLAKWYEKHGFERISGNKVEGYRMLYKGKSND